MNKDCHVCGTYFDVCGYDVHSMEVAVDVNGKAFDETHIYFAVLRKTSFLFAMGT